MKLGSANKWIELLQATNPKFLNDGYGLLWDDGTFSPVGNLENFITKDWKLLEHTGCYANIEGSICRASKECLSKCKCKGDLELIDDAWHKLRDLEMLCLLIGYNQETL